MRLKLYWRRAAVLLCGLSLLFAACSGSNGNRQGSDGPSNPGTPTATQLGDKIAGQTVFRTETFGNEGFWTDALRLPQGLVANHVTPLQALALGLSVNVDALDAATQQAITAQLQTDPSGTSSALLNDPATTLKLINANAIIGLPIKDSNGDGVLDVSNGDKVGASCALCHAVTDGAVFKRAGAGAISGGSIGHEVDGPAAHELDFGTLISMGTNSRAYFPVLQLALTANGGKTLGRAPTGLTANSTEAEVDAYLTNKAYYPVGMFDDTVDGNGDPMHNMPLFRQDLASPFGSGGEISREDNFANTVYTALLDPTNVTTAGGRAFLQKLGGDTAGAEIANSYVQVLAATGVTGYPYVKATAPTDASQAGSEDYPLGVRVDNTELINMNAYVFSLSAPAGIVTDASAVERGRDMFRTAGCTSCHNVDQSKFVPTFIVPMTTIFPGDNPVVLLAQRQAPLNPILNTVDNIFDDKMAVVNASLRGLERGTALPLLMDLARKPVFLHDNSVPSLDNLLDPVRGAMAPHPFFVTDSSQRADAVAFLESLDDKDTP